MIFSRLRKWPFLLRIDNFRSLAESDLSVLRKCFVIFSSFIGECSLLWSTFHDILFVLIRTRCAIDSSITLCLFFQCDVHCIRVNFSRIHVLYKVEIPKDTLVSRHELHPSMRNGLFLHHHSTSIFLFLYTYTYVHFVVMSLMLLDYFVELI